MNRIYINFGEDTNADGRYASCYKPIYFTNYKQLSIVTIVTFVTHKYVVNVVKLLWKLSCS